MLLPRLFPDWLPNQRPAKGEVSLPWSHWFHRNIVVWGTVSSLVQGERPPKTWSLPDVPQNSQRLIFLPKHHGHTSCRCSAQSCWWLLVLDGRSGRPLGTSNLGYSRVSYTSLTPKPLENYFPANKDVPWWSSSSQSWSDAHLSPCLAPPHQGLHERKRELPPFCLQYWCFVLPRTALEMDLYQNIPFHQSLQLNASPKKSFFWCQIFKQFLV